MKITMLAANQLMVQRQYETELIDQIYNRANVLMMYELNGKPVFKSILKDQKRPNVIAIIEIMEKEIEYLQSAIEKLQENPEDS